MSNYTPNDLISKPPPHPAGRRCRTCANPLSRYNGDDRCYLHRTPMTEREVTKMVNDWARNR